MWECCARISSYPKLEGFYGLFQVPGNHLLVASRDEVLLRLAGSVAQFVGFAVTLSIHTEFARTVVCDAQPGISEREIWVEFDGPLIKRDSRSIPGCDMRFESQTEGFQGVKRRRRGLLQWSVEFLDRAQGLAQFVAHLRSRLPQCIEYMILVTRLCFRTRQRFAAGVVDCLHRQKVGRPNLSDRAFEHSSTCRPLADFARNLRRQLRVRLLAHHPESLVDLLVRDNAQEG